MKDAVRLLCGYCYCWHWSFNKPPTPITITVAVHSARRLSIPTPQLLEAQLIYAEGLGRVMSYRIKER